MSQYVDIKVQEMVYWSKQPGAEPAQDHGYMSRLWRRPQRTLSGNIDTVHCKTAGCIEYQWDQFSLDPEFKNSASS